MMIIIIIFMIIIMMIIIMSMIILSQVDKRRRERSVWRLASLSKLRQGSLPGQNDNNNKNDTATTRVKFGKINIW